MPYIVGTDEAGYGPNFGPLVISASVWQVAEDPRCVDLYERLGEAVCACHEDAAADGRLAVADSKRLYKAGGTLEALERGVLSALWQLNDPPRDWLELWDRLTGRRGAHCQSLPWYAGYTREVPVAVTTFDIARSAERLAETMQRQGVELVALASVACFPEEFNTLVDELGGKGALLTRLTLELLASVLAPLSEPALVVCDKHGGRNRYAANLQEYFPEYLIEVRGESRAESIYRWGPRERGVEVRFRSGGEAFLPTALASMTSKYLRELAMVAFNAFWTGHLPGLKPTAGYPQDARRYKAAIAACQTELGVEDKILWRVR